PRGLGPGLILRRGGGRPDLDPLVVLPGGPDRVVRHPGGCDAGPGPEPGTAHSRRTRSEPRPERIRSGTHGGRRPVRSQPHLSEDLVMQIPITASLTRRTFLQTAMTGLAGCSSMAGRRPGAAEIAP